MTPRALILHAAFEKASSNAHEIRNQVLLVRATIKEEQTTFEPRPFFSLPNQVAEVWPGHSNAFAIPTGSFAIDRVSTCSYNVFVPKSRTTRNPHFPLREAKNRLSELVKRAAQGEQITITLHGEPRVQLSRVVERSRLFEVDWKWLKGMRVGASQTPADALIRTERDGRD